MCEVGLGLGPLPLQQLQVAACKCTTFFYLSLCVRLLRVLLKDCCCRNGHDFSPLEDQPFDRRGRSSTEEALFFHSEKIKMVVPSAKKPPVFFSHKFPTGVPNCRIGASDTYVGATSTPTDSMQPHLFHRVCHVEMW